MESHFQHSRNMGIGRPRSSMRRTYFPPSLFSPNLNHTFTDNHIRRPPPHLRPPHPNHPLPLALPLVLPFTRPMPQPHRNPPPNPTTHRNNPPLQQPKPKSPPPPSPLRSTRSIMASLPEPHLPRPRNARRPEPRHFSLYKLEMEHLGLTGFDAKEPPSVRDGCGEGVFGC